MTAREPVTDRVLPFNFRMVLASIVAMGVGAGCGEAPRGRLQGTTATTAGTASGAPNAGATSPLANGTAPDGADVAPSGSDTAKATPSPATPTPTPTPSTPTPASTPEVPPTPTPSTARVLSVVPVWETPNRLGFVELLADGTKRFQHVRVDVIPEIAAAKHRIAFGDFDNDKNLDVLFITQPPFIALRKETTIETWPLTAGAPWLVEGVGDFDGDGFTDILWRNRTTLAVHTWLLGPNRSTRPGALPSRGYEWSMIGTADFDGDGKDDIFWRNRNTNVTYWKMNGLNPPVGTVIGSNRMVPFLWSVRQIADYDGDGKDDILWTRVPTETEPASIATVWSDVGAKPEPKFLSLATKNVKPLSARPFPENAGKAFAPLLVEAAHRILTWAGTDFTVGTQFDHVEGSSILPRDWGSAVALSFGGYELHEKNQRAVPLPPPPPAPAQ